MKPTSDSKSSPADEVKYWRPEDVPDDLSPLERAIIAARNHRAWADWAISNMPAPEQGGSLIDVGEKAQGGE